MPFGPAFSARVWQDTARAQQRPYPRLTMADDLIRRGALIGLSVDSLVALLGPKPETTYFKKWDFVYWLGIERSLVAIDSEWLVIAIGPDGRVSKAEILRD